MLHVNYLLMSVEGFQLIKYQMLRCVFPTKVFEYGVFNQCFASPHKIVCCYAHVSGCMKNVALLP